MLEKDAINVKSSDDKGRFMLFVKLRVTSNDKDNTCPERMKGIEG